VRTLIAGLMAAGLVAWASAEPADTNKTVITGKRLDFDYKNSIAKFEENVYVRDPQIEIWCDNMTVMLEAAESKVKSVTAIGNVKLQQGDKTGRCQRAVYVAKLGEIVLTGDPKSGDAVLNIGKDYTVKGKIITFYVNDDRMTVEPGQLFISPPADTNKAAKLRFLE
jgi:lipopolysaccharide transport protein LptA